MKLRRSIGTKALFLLVINAILGTGIFFLPAIGMKYAGTASIFSWLIMSVVAILTSLIFAELISMKPESGCVYKVVKSAFGEFYGFLFGWISWIAANITISMLIVGSFNYLFPGIGAVYAIAISLACVLLFNFVNYRGIGISAKMLVVFGVLTLAGLLVLLVPGVPLAASGTLELGGFSFSLVFLAVYFIAETFFGWETATYLADEVKNPEKTLPKMLVVTTIVIAAISCLLVYVAAMLGPETFSASPSPLSALFSLIYGTKYAFLFSVVIFVPLLGTAASWIVSSPRLLYAMSKDRVLVKHFGEVHKKNNVPHKAILFQTCVTSVLTVLAFGNFFTLLMLLIPLVLMMYLLVIFAYIKTKSLGVSGSFKNPLGEKGGWLVILVYIFLLVAWLQKTDNAFYILSMGLMLVFIGMPMYVIIKLYTDRSFVEKFYNRLSVVWDPLFSLWYSDNEAKKVISNLSLNESSRVVDFGCGTGKTTKHVAKKARRGVVVAIDISEKQLEKAAKKMKAEGIKNVVFIKDYKLRLRKNFDCLTAVGVLEHLENPGQALKNMTGTLKKNGTFSILCFGKSFGIVGSPHFSDEASVRRLFSGLGVELHVKKEHKRFAQYWYIWGKKK